MVRPEDVFTVMFRAGCQEMRCDQHQSGYAQSQRRKTHSRDQWPRNELYEDNGRLESWNLTAKSRVQPFPFHRKTERIGVPQSARLDCDKLTIDIEAN